MKTRRAEARKFWVLFFTLFMLLILYVVFTQPFVCHRLATKIFTAYEIYHLKYPDSYLVEREIIATSKVTMSTRFTYQISDDIETVLGYMEVQHPGFNQLHGSRVINEPTYMKTTCAEESMFRSIFETLNKGMPCIEVIFFPTTTKGTTIIISENWPSMGFPEWLREW